MIVAAQDLAQDKIGNEEMETFLPMLPLEGTTVIKREISTLRKAGISPIMVAGGYQAAVLKNHISHNGVIFHEDTSYAQHDWKTSARLAIREMAPDCDALILIPVECPAFTVETVRKLAECTENAQVSYRGRSEDRRSIYPPDAGFQSTLCENQGRTVQDRSFHQGYTFSVECFLKK